MGRAYLEGPFDVITGKAVRWTEDGRFETELEPFIPLSFEDIFRKGLCLPQPSTFIRTELFKRALPPPGLVNILVDTATYLRLWMEKDLEISSCVVPEVLAHVQNHHKAQTVSQGLKTKEEIKKIYSFLASEAKGIKARILTDRNLLHHFLDRLEDIAACPEKGFWKLLQLFSQYPEIIYQRSFWGAVKKKLY